MLFCSSAVPGNGENPTCSSTDAEKNYSDAAVTMNGAVVFKFTVSLISAVNLVI